MALKTLVRINQDHLRREAGETYADAAKREARGDFLSIYPNEVIRACGIVEIDSVKRHIVVLIVWD